MFVVRRVKWTRQGFYLMLAGLALGTAWLLRQTQGAAILEIYSLIGRPFQSEPTAALEARLTNVRIQELEGQVEDLKAQNQQLQALLGYARSQKQPVIAAPIVGRSPDDWWKQVILGRGSQEGVNIGAAVTGIGGVIGRVVQVMPHTSRILLISDPTSRVGAAIARSRSMGLVQGQGSQTAVMQFFEKVPDVRPGDLVTTSAVSRLFPTGLPIGRIKSVNLESGTAPEAILEFTAPIEHLEWVTVHPKQDGE
jgi:rod shape-determining protein MreC